MASENLLEGRADEVILQRRREATEAMAEAARARGWAPEPSAKRWTGTTTANIGEKRQACPKCGFERGVLVPEKGTGILICSGCAGGDA